MKVHIDKKVYLDSECSKLDEINAWINIFESKLTQSRRQLADADVNKARKIQIDEVWYAKAQRFVMVRENTVKQLRELRNIVKKKYVTDNAPLSLADHFLEICRERMDPRLLSTIIKEAEERGEQWSQYDR